VKDETLGVALAPYAVADGEVTTLGIVLGAGKHAGFVAGVSVAVDEEDGGPSLLGYVPFGGEGGGV